MDSIMTDPTILPIRRVWCAWCHPDQSPPPLGTVAHGICEAHAAELLADAALPVEERTR
jgi:hypothetical protein